jgi:hypothetical protein
MNKLVLSCGLVMALMSTVPAAAQYVSPQAGVRCGANGCWENDRYGRPTGRRFYFDDRRPLSPQAGIRCGANGCWENDAYGRPTGRRGYFR